MLIFERKATNDLQDALDGAITDATDYVNGALYPKDLKVYLKKIKRWRKLFDLISEFNADPDDAHIYTVILEHYDEETAPDCIWNQSYRSLEAAQAEVLEECLRYRREEEVGSFVNLLPNWVTCDNRLAWVLDDSSIDRVWTITRTTLK